MRIPDDPAIINAVEDMLAYLTLQHVWMPYRDDADYAIRARMTQMFTEFMESDACMIGAIIDTARGTLPPHWLPCDGSVYLREDFPRLYAVLDGELILNADEFVTPDLRGRVTIGENLVENYDPLWEIREFNQHGGEENHQLITNELASHGHSTFPHSHSYTAPVHIGIETLPGEIPIPIPIPTPTTSTTDSVEVNIEPSGGGQAHNNMQPFRVVKKVIIAR